MNGFAIALLTMASISNAIKLKEIKLYFPITVGDTAVYSEVINDKKLRDVAKIVSKVERKGLSYVLSIENSIRDGFGTHEMDMVVSDGSLEIKWPSEAVAHAIGTILNFAAKSEEPWKTEYFAGGQKAVIQFTQKGTEEVEVTAGKYRALRVDSEVKGISPSVTITEWYAPSVGLVKSVSKFGELESCVVLKSFKPGKK
jgi:hypothetical protein